MTSQVHALSFEIDYAHEQDGWIDCKIIVNGTPHHLSASSALPPFLHLMQFIKAAAGEKLPHSFFWDEEGYGAKFEVAEVLENTSLVHLKIVHTGETTETWFDADIEREMVVQAFLDPLLDFSRNYNNIVDKKWELPSRVLEHVHDTIAKGLPLIVDPHAPNHVDFVIFPSYFSSFTEDHINLQLWIEDDFTFHVSLEDTSPFWPSLIDFLDKIANFTLPAEFNFINDLYFSLLGKLVSSVKGYASKYRLIATNAEEPENFRLQIYVQSENERLITDAVINRKQFTHAFVEAFGEFLQDEYQTSVDRNGKVFDLRTISLAKITRL
ncbi:MAG: hypothetical protein U0V02_12400 [Anaerolineales bacterium]